MTVCVGAICDGGKCVVAAADRMMTFGTPMNLQAEGAVRKIVPLTDRAVLLFSGSVPDGEFLVESTRQKMRGEANPDVRKIAELTADAYRELKKQRAEETILIPFLGITFDGFVQLAAQSASSQTLQQVLGLISNHNLELEIIIAGVDDEDSNCAHLYAISHPGKLSPLDTVGFAAVGSGGMHAAVRMSLGSHSKNDEPGITMFSVFEAKVASEVAPGVGKIMDMAVITRGGTLFVEDDDFKQLVSIHKERPTLEDEEKESLSEIAARYVS